VDKKEKVLEQDGALERVRARARTWIRYLAYAIRREVLSALGNAWIVRKYRKEVEHIGKGTSMGVGIEFKARRIRIGDYVAIRPHCRFVGEGSVDIGSGTMIGPETVVMSSMPSYEDPDCLPFGDRAVPLSVELGKGIWIGHKVMIYPGVKIGDGAIVGMGAVVTEDVPPYATVGGNPAKILKIRGGKTFQSLLSEEQFFLKEANRWRLSRRKELWRSKDERAREEQ
jgi:acetyltransferase-like isoleucine patch superfamily enzyme